MLARAPFLHHMKTFRYSGATLVSSVACLALLASVVLTQSTAYAFDPAKGEKVFLRCKACHSAEKNAKHRIGPKLWGIIGKKAGTQENFKYSSAMENFGKIWDQKTLDAYLEKPTKIVPGSRMVFVGIKDPQQRSDLIAYLNSKSDKPIQLKATSKKKKTTSTTKKAASESNLLPPGEGRAETEAYCSPCHSLKIVVQQGLSKEDWDELLVWMVEEQEMEPIEAADRKKVIKYLAKNFNTNRPNFQQ